ncbi:MAG TPA: hypothetical protein VMH34_03000 [Gammaproteobacteria bacterium]|nr:hypothetical protein [Gammaproteobacteria bacterium]
MSIYVIRACRAKKGKGRDVQQLLKKAIENMPSSFVYQSKGDANDFGIFVEFDGEKAAREFADSDEQAAITRQLTSMVEDATPITVWSRV